MKKKKNLLNKHSVFLLIVHKIKLVKKEKFIKLKFMKKKKLLNILNTRAN